MHVNGGKPLAEPMVAPSIAVFLQRDRTRALLRAAFPRRRGRIVVARSSAAFEVAFREALVDAAIVDVGMPSSTGTEEDSWRAATLAREFPSVPFFGVLPLRSSESATLARCAEFDFADVLIEGVDDMAARELITRESFSARFAFALREPPTSLALSSHVQRAAWRYLVAQAGRPVRTAALAQALRVTREHLSRTFAASGGPNLKRVIDLVRLLSAAELAKNPGYDLRDVSRVLGFASASHLSTTAQRVVGTKPASLTRLRTVDLVDRFVRGHGRSRPRT